MRHFIEVARGQVRKSVLRDRASEPLVERFSRYLWPWGEAWLVRLVLLVAVLDYLSTYALLELSGRLDVYEGGLIAHRALQLGGFRGLLLMDVVEVGTLCLLAASARFLYTRFGFNGFARAAFVACLFPYVVAALLATTNNLVGTVV